MHFVKTRDRVEPVYAAEYGGALADHLPMALSALARMGAGEQRRQAYQREYVRAKGLRILGADEPERQARLAMRERIESEGRTNVLRDELSSLARGIGAGAFHALIRVAYGIADENDTEIAAGLIYWRAVAFDIGAAASAPDDRHFDVSLALDLARAQLGHLSDTLGDGLIAERMATVSANPAFDATLGHPHFNEDSLAKIAAVTVRAFAATRNFTLLHAMTAAHALRIVLPFAGDREALLQAFWRAYVAAYISAGAPALPEDGSFASDLACAPEWEALLEHATASPDEHVVKAAYTAWSEDTIYHDPLYRVATARYLKF